MHDRSRLGPSNLPSTSSLIKATLAALTVSATLLVTAVLPAEYGIDPTGLGRVMGLDQLNQAGTSGMDTPQQAVAEEQEYPNSPVWKAGNAPRSDTLKIPLMPGQGAEIKSRMDPGDNFVFSWQVEGGGVSFDMHGERPNSGGAFTSYWMGDNQTEASGSFSAPFSGTHGWYWENTGDQPVTVTLKTQGFYQGLYMP